MKKFRSGFARKLSEMRREMCARCGEKLSEVLDDFIMSPKGPGGKVDDPHDSSQHARDKRMPWGEDEVTRLARREDEEEANRAGLQYRGEDEEDEEDEEVRESWRKVHYGVPPRVHDVVTGRVTGRR